VFSKENAIGTFWIPHHKTSLTRKAKAFVCVEQEKSQTKGHLSEKVTMTSFSSIDVALLDKMSLTMSQCLTKCQATIKFRCDTTKPPNEKKVAH
jgi:hypothetical protein